MSHDLKGRGGPTHPLRFAVGAVVATALLAIFTLSQSVGGFAATPTATATPVTYVAATAPPTPTPAPKTTRYLVKFETGTSAAQQSAALNGAGGAVNRSIPQLNWHSISIPFAALSGLQRNPRVVAIVPDNTRRVAAAPSDAEYSSQWALPLIGWDQLYGTATPPGLAAVALLDTGVDASHPDLAGSLTAGTSIIDGSGGTLDLHGHGTAMAGIVAAKTNNVLGVAGVGYAGVRVMPVTVLAADGTGTDADVIAGVVYAADNGARVILMPFAAPDFSPALQDAIDYAWSRDAVLVAAGGNGGTATPMYPAGDRGVIGVSSTTSADTVDAASNSGAHVFLGAPGAGIRTTAAGGGYTTVSGSSAAAAHVAASAALLRALDPTLTQGVTVGRLAATADAVGTVETTGNGRLNLARAASSVATTPIQPAGAPPLGSGGPFVGPYLVAANNDAHVAPGWAPTNTVTTFSTLYRKTAGSTVQHVRITLPAGYTTISVPAAAFSSGTWSTPVVNQVARTVDVQLTAGTGLATNNVDWARIDVMATTPLANQSGNAADWLMQTFTNTAGTTGEQNDNPPVLIGTTTNPSAVITFVDAGGAVIPALVLTNGVASTVRVRLTSTSSGTTIKYTDVAVPTCFTSPSGVSTASSAGGTGGYSPTVTDGFIRMPSGSIPTTGFLTVEFTTTPNCVLGTYLVSTTPSTNATNPPSGTNQSVSTTGGSLTVGVVAANAAPVAVDDAYTTDEDTALVLDATKTAGAPVGPADNDTDANLGDTLTVTAVNNATGGTVSLSGGITFTPTANVCEPGVYGFDYTISDGSLTDTGHVDVTITCINDAPSFVKGADQTVNEDAGAQTVAGWATAISPGGGADEATQTVGFTVTGNTNPTLFSVAPAVSTRGAGGSPVGGNLTYTPAANANGSATITLKAVDSGLNTPPNVNESATQTFTITVNAVNDAPSFVSGGDVTVNEDSGAYSAAWATLTNDGDPEVVQTLTFNVTGNTNPGLFSVAPAVSSAGVLSFTPAANANGVASITVTLSDNGGTANGGVDTSAPQSFTINVTAVNDAPSGANNTVTTNEDTDYVFLTTDFGFSDPNDTPPNTLAAVRITSLATNGKVQLGGVDVTAGQVVLVADITAGNLKFRPDSNENGTPYATFTFQVQDNGLGTPAPNENLDPTPNTMTINVTAVNDAPVCADVSLTTNEDVDGSTSPDCTDVDSVTLTYSVVADASDGTAGVAAGLLTYDPDLNFFGSDSFTYRAHDGALYSNTANVAVTVNPVNDAPSFVSGGNVTVNEDSGAYSAAWATSISKGPANEGGQVLTFHVSNDNNALFSVQPDIDESTGNLSFTPAANAFGSATVSVYLTDNGGDANGGDDTSDTVQFTLTVNAVNDAPSFASGGNVTVDEDSPAYSAVWATSISKGPANESGQVLTFHVSNDNNALFSAQPDVDETTGNLSFTPAANAFGSAIVSVHLSDNGGIANSGDDTSDTVQFTITVSAVNDQPTVTLTSPPATANEGQTRAYPFTIVDVDDTVFNFKAGSPDCDSGGSAGTLVLVPAASITGFTGTFSCLFPDGLASPTVEVCVVDSGGGTSPPNLLDGCDLQPVTVANVNPTVTITGDNTAFEGETKTYNYSTTDPGSPETFSLVGSPNCGLGGIASNISAISGAGGGSFDCTFPDGVTPAASTQLQVCVSDGDGGTGCDEHLVTVANVAPEVSALSGDPTAFEGDIKTYSFTVTDPGKSNEVFAFDTGFPFCGTGNTVSDPTIDASTGAGSFKCTFADGPSTPGVTVKVLDGDGGEDTETKTVTVANVAPVADAGADQSGAEGSSLSFVFDCTDAGTADTWTATVNWGDGSAVQNLGAVTCNSAGTFGASHTYADNGSYTVTLTVTDDDTGTHADTATATVSNVAPVADAGADQSGAEGSSLSFVFDCTDAGTADTWTATVNWGDGSAVQSLGAVTCNSAGTFGASHTYADNGSYTVTLTVTDDDTGSHADTATATVSNVAPVADAGADQSGAEGSSLSFVFDCTDAGTADTWTATVNWGDGSAVQSLGAVTCNSAGTFGASHTYADNGSYTVTLTVTDDDTGTHADTATVTVANVAPTVVGTFSCALGTINEAGSTTCSASYTDAGAQDTHTCTFNWGEGAPQTVAPWSPGVCSASHVYADDNPTATASDTYAVSLTVTDDDTGSDTETSSVKVNNVPPTLTLTPPAGLVLAEPGVVNFNVAGNASATYTDPGTLDTHTCLFKWDDGMPDTSVAGSSGRCSTTHTYSTQGVYTITVRVTDDDTEVDEETMIVVVYDPGAGFVTGGGWIRTNANMYTPPPMAPNILAGCPAVAESALTSTQAAQCKGHFGFVSKYQKGASIPSGETEFQLQVAGFKFQSTSYQWLVVSGTSKAQYKGSGKVNGAGDYGFLLTANDGGNTGDKFRIKIWEKNITGGEGATIFDNRMGASVDIDSADPQLIAQGSIVIHTNNGKNN